MKTISSLASCARGHISRPLIGFLLALLLCAVYWAHLISDQAVQLKYAESQTQLRATQMSATLTTQVSTLMAGLEYLAHSLATTYAADPKRYFPLAVSTALKTFPRGSIVQIAVTDAAGGIIYSSLADQQRSSLPKISIADREHFLVHTKGSQARLFISRPVLGRVSGKWGIQFSYPVLREGRFAGVVVLSIAPDYISGYFREVFTGSSDVAFLVRNDGSYLARSNLQDSVLDKSVPPELEFITNPQAMHGEYQVQAPIDGVERYYGWNRLKNYPLIVSVGLDRNRALAATRDAIHDSRLRHAFGTAIILAAALWIALLFFRVRRKQVLLQESQQRYQLALEGGELGAWDWDLSNGYMHVDRRLTDTLGMAPGELEPSLEGILNLTHPDDKAGTQIALDRLLDGKTEGFEVEQRMRHHDGHWCWINARGKVTLRDADGRARRVFGTFTDVSARRASEAARIALQESLTKLMAQVPGVVYQYRLGADGRNSFPYASPGIIDIYDMTPEAAMQNAAPVFEHIHPEDLGLVQTSIEASARMLTAWECEFRFIGANGAVRWLSGHAKPERESDGSTLWHGYIHDNTAQHAAHEALRRSEERLRLTTAAVRDGLWEWNPSSGTIKLDARCSEMLGYPAQPGSLDFQDWTRLLHPQDSPKILSLLQHHIALGEPFNTEVRLRTAGGEWCWVEIRGQLIPSSNGSEKLVMGTQTDISQRMAEAKLRLALLNNAAAALFVTGQDNTIHLANQRAVDTFSVDGLPLAGSKLRQIFRDDASFATFEQLCTDLRTAGEVKIEDQLRTAGGAPRWFNLRGTRLDAEQPAGDLIWTMVDTTERRSAEEALNAARAHLLEVIQHFPGGVLVQDVSGKVVVINQTLCDLFGIQTPPAALVGLDPDALRDQVSQNLLESWPDAAALAVRSAAMSRDFQLTDGRTFRVNFIPLQSGDMDIGRMWIVRDITERRQHEQSLEHMATTDVLTGLANRRAFMTRLEAELALIEQGGKPGMLIMLDLDHFKLVNDTYGHAAGDKVLVHLAQLLRGNSLRKADLAGRVGGEEFAVLLPNTSPDNGAAIAERLRLALEQSLIDSGDGHTIQITLSAGVAPLGVDAVASLAQADAALYQAKNSGRNRIVMA